MAGPRGSRAPERPGDTRTERSAVQRGAPPASPPSPEPASPAGRLIGYARVSTRDQDPLLQLGALRAAGVPGPDLFVEHASGRLRSRPQLELCLRSLQRGDTLVVWKLSRLGRSTPHLYAILERLQRLGAELHSVTEGIDTHTAAGRAMFGMLAVMAQFEREVLVENTLAGLAAARAQGHTGGRRPAITGTRLAVAHRLLSEGQSVTQVATILGVARSTVYRALRAEVDAAVER